MKADNYVLKDYFDRIGYSGGPRSDIETVTELMRSQLFSVPFENLDVQAGKIISIVPEDIVDKIVYRNRGGYCYEVNGIFSMALTELGIQYQFVAARPMTYPDRRPRTHIAIVMKIDGEDWFCDLGFGPYTIRYPMRLNDIESELRHDDEIFALKKENEREYLLKQSLDGTWFNLYSFDLWPQEWVDFIPANYLNSTHPESLFVQKYMVALHNPVGKTFLVGNTLTNIENENVTKRTLFEHEIDDVLSNTFGLPRLSALL